jgi:DNA gyrase subunit B
MKRLSKYYPGELICLLLSVSTLHKSDLLDSDKVLSWLKEIEEKLSLTNQRKSSLILKYEGGPEIQITSQVHGIADVTSIPLDFFKTIEYRKIKELADKLYGLLEEGSFVKRNDKKMEITNFGQGLDWLMEEGKKGISIQRYKGLGEMNPEQLWETTMNAESRRLLRVRIEDAIGADEIFTTLMGDVVEPRKLFIEKNAMAAENLDI